MVVNAVLSLVLSIQIGLLGAVYGSIAGNVAGTAIFLVIVRRHLTYWTAPPWAALSLTALVSALMIGTGWDSRGSLPALGSPPSASRCWWESPALRRSVSRSGPAHGARPTFRPTPDPRRRPMTRAPWRQRLAYHSLVRAAGRTRTGIRGRLWTGAWLRLTPGMSGTSRVEIHGSRVVVNAGYAYPAFYRRWTRYNDPLVELVQRTHLHSGRPITVVDVGAAVGDTALLVMDRCPARWRSSGASSRTMSSSGT